MAGSIAQFLSTLTGVAPRRRPGGGLAAFAAGLGAPGREGRLMSWQILAVAAFYLLALEMLTPTTIFLWMAIGLAFASFSAYLGADLVIQVGVAVLGMCGSIATYFFRKPAPKELPPILSWCCMASMGSRSRS